MIRALLVSTYDLGRQPFALASAAAWLARAGVDVACMDLAAESFDAERVRAADVIALHVPMHTATRLALDLIPRLCAAHAEAKLIAFGLYAPMNAGRLAAAGCSAMLGGEFEAALVDEVLRLAGGGTPDPTPHARLDRLAFITPRRDTLPPLGRYARLDDGTGARRLVGATEASRGCKHRCRHCPVVPVYGGRFRVVPRAVVLADIDALVGAGAGHITFGDPDFWNGIGHAMPLVHELHRRHPDVTYDVTIKIEHLRQYDAHLPALRDTGCAFVTSAVESVDDAVLTKLEKGHTRADFEAVAARFRALGLVLQPTFVAFHPWISRAGYRELLQVIEALDLVEHLAPVQLGLRLLIPAGSRLLELEEVRALIQPFDPERLCHPWAHPDRTVDALQQAVDACVREGTSQGRSRAALFEHVRALADAWGGDVPGAQVLALSHARDRAARHDAARSHAGFTHAAVQPKRPPVPFLTEPWYC